MKGSVSLGKRAGMPAESQEGTVSGWELGGQATLAGDEPGSWHWQRQPRGKGRSVELGSENWPEPLTGQMF